MSASTANNEEERLWGVVTRDPTDFSSWQLLVQHADTTRDLDRITRAYSSFLSEFPLCFVYWNKFAQHCRDLHSDARAYDTYEKAVLACPHSVDLWIGYASFVLAPAKRAADEETAERARGVFERGVTVVGLDYASWPLWDKYAEFERSCSDGASVKAVLERALRVPMEHGAACWEKLRLLLEVLPLSELGVGMCEEEQESEARAKIVAEEEREFREAAEQAVARKPFETLVLKRPYFHVMPLAEVQLANWRKYLEWEEEQGNHKRIMKLYERCLVACVAYPEFWYMFVSYLERRGMLPEAREVFKRGVASLFLRKNVEFVQAFALFDEVNNEIESAREIHKALLGRVAGDLRALLGWASFERRRGDLSKCEEVYRIGLDASANDEQAHAFLMLHMAKSKQGSSSVQDTREAYERATERHPGVKAVWEAFITFEIDVGGDQSAVMTLFDRASSAETPLSVAEKAEVVCLWEEFLNEWCHDPKLIRQWRPVVTERKAKLRPSSRKRRSEAAAGPSPRAVLPQATPQTSTAPATQQQSTPAAPSQLPSQPPVKAVRTEADSNGVRSSGTQSALLPAPSFVGAIASPIAAVPSFGLPGATGVGAGAWPAGMYQVPSMTVPMPGFSTIPNVPLTPQQIAMMAQAHAVQVQNQPQQPQVWPTSAGPWQMMQRRP